jgi:sulfur-oxidizing protein SoxX
MRWLLLLLLAFPAAAQTPEVEKTVADTFKDATGIWAARVPQDDTQRLCSLRRNEPTAAEAADIMAREAKTIVMPQGPVLGDWKRGEDIAQNGRGGQFSDPPGTASGGNCYACHQMAPAELSYGTLGPSLLNYGKLKDFAPEAARAAYAKIYNAQAAVACTTMPRFGHNGILTEQQIKDAVAYLFDPKSPVNASVP